MGVPLVERREEVVRNKVGDVWFRSSNRFQSILYRSKVSAPTKLIESQPLDVPVPRVFSQTCSILWIVYAIHLTGVFATFDKTGDIKVEIKVPSEARMGSSVELSCEWQLSGQNGLYSVKWYKDDHEFFRYLPDANPRIQTFSQPGINVDNHWKNKESIRLKDLEARSSGQYKCEVSTEGPSFATVYRTANLTVIALPERGPEITGLSSRYAIGDDVSANCTVWPSMPKAVIRWLVNGKPIARKKTIQYSRMEMKGKEEEEERANVVGLLVKLKPSQFQHIEKKSTVAIKCIAEIGLNLLETERRVPIDYDSHRDAYADNQRLSGGDARSKGHRVHSRFSLLLICYVSFRLRTIKM